MFKLSRIILILTTLSTLVLVTEASFRFFQPKAQFFIINKSQDRKAVDISIQLGGQIVFSDTIKYSNVSPDLQYTPSITLTKGKYTIFVTADNGKVQVQQPIMIDGDRFVFVTYSYKAPVDSATIIKDFGFPFADKLKGQEPEIGIYITHKEPVHL